MRLLLADQGAEWTDEVVTFERWTSGECNLKKEAVFGQMPKFSDGDFVLYQSNAILRYLGRKYGLYGKTDKEAAIVDMVNEGVEDVRLKYARFMSTEYVMARGFENPSCLFDAWETAKEKYVADLPNQFLPFECILAKNPGGFLVGDQTSYADYSLLHFLHNQLWLAPDCLSAFPRLKAYVSKMDARPSIKAYMETEAYKNRLIHPKEKR